MTIYRHVSSADCALRAALGAIMLGWLISEAAMAQQTPPSAAPIELSPLAKVRNGRESKNNNQILTTGIRSPHLSSNHALIITVAEYAHGSLPGVATDRKMGIELAERFGVPEKNIVELSERQVTRAGLKQAFESMDQVLFPGDKLFIYYSGHGSRFYSQSTKQCEESIVMQDMHAVTKNEFANWVKPLSSKADKTLVMLDSCHSGGFAPAASSRGISSELGEQRPKFSAEASSPQCSVAVNEGIFSQSRGIDLATTDNNIVILAAAKKNEIAWDTSKGGALTYNFGQCLNGGADTDHSGSVSMQELVACVQARLDKTQVESMRQHVTLAGNAALVPAFVETSPPAQGAVADSAPAIVPAEAVDSLAALNDIYSQRDDRWQVQVSLDHPSLKIGSNLTLSVRSSRNGYVYLFYRGSQPNSLYLLFPNQLDSTNTITANEELQLPHPEWSVTALGPRGTDHILVLVTETARDFSSLSLPAEYVSAAGPFDKIQPTTQAIERIAQIALLSAATKQLQCTSTDSKRDLGVARRCSNIFGAGMVSVEETE